MDEERRTSFDRQAELYDAVRPSYPDAIADAVVARGTRVLELGAGTGKATVVIARRGASVTALEPGAQLAAVLRRNTAGLDVEVVESRFEDYAVERRFDAVMAAQSFHWMDPATKCQRVAAALVEGGAIAVVRNQSEPFTGALGVAIEAAYARYLPGESPRTVAQVIEEQVAELDASGCFEGVEVTQVPWTERLTTARYLELLATYSDHAVLPAERRAGLFAAIADALAGGVEITYISLAFVAARR